MGIICLYVLIQKSGQKTAKSHLCAMVCREENRCSSLNCASKNAVLLQKVFCPIVLMKELATHSNFKETRIRGFLRCLSSY